MRFNHGIRRCAASALALSLMAETMVWTGAQVVPIAKPFIGNHSETWEEFPNFVDYPGPLLSLTTIMNGDATIANADLSVYQPGVADATLGLSGFAQTSDGTKGAQIGFNDPTATLTFVRPVTDFGAYWGAETNGVAAAITVDFFDANNALLDRETLVYDHETTADGGLDWHGWHSTLAAASMTITGSNFVIDGLQANLVPEPGITAFCVMLALSSISLLRRRKLRSSPTF